MSSKPIYFRLLNRKLLTPTVQELELEPQSSFLFNSGDYLNLQHADEKMNYSYSIVSTPITTNNNIYVCIKDIPNGKMSQFLLQIPIGTTLIGTGPFSQFPIPKTFDKQICFLSTGIGIAPFRSIAHYLKQEYKQNVEEKILFISGFSTPSERVYNEDLKIFKRIYCLPDLEDHKKKEQNQEIYFQGTIIDYLLSTDFADRFLHSIENVYFYLCGNKNILIEAKSILLSKGFSNQCIFS